MVDSQPMQILGEQRANQRGRQPLQRSELLLVTKRKRRDGGEAPVSGVKG